MFLNLSLLNGDNDVLSFTWFALLALTPDNSAWSKISIYMVVWTLHSLMHFCFKSFLNVNEMF